MTKNIFLDTNVIIDFLDRNRKGHTKAQELIRYLVLNDHSIFISEDMLSTLFYIIKNKKATLAFFKSILDRWHVVSFGVALIEDAVNIALEEDQDLEDILQCLCAQKNGCTALITHDKKFYDCGLSIYTADEFLREKE